MEIRSLIKANYLGEFRRYIHDSYTFECGVGLIILGHMIQLQEMYDVKSTQQHE